MREQFRYPAIASVALWCIAVGAITTTGQLVWVQQLQAQIKPDVVFTGKDGLIAVEAEHFFKQTETSVRAFHLTHADASPTIKPDGDPPHVGGASGGAYLEILPDSRRTHSDKLQKGVNFSPEPGKMAVLHYNVHFATAGRYYVWVRAYSTGTEDNGLHVGIHGKWPSSGQRLQWCAGKNTWRWESRQRTNAQHCGEPHKIFLDIQKPGQHVVAFSMREDGFEFDKFILTTSRNFVPPRSVGPAAIVQSGEPPASFAFVQPPKPATGDTSSQPAAAAATPLQMPRKPDGNGKVSVHGELKQWHNVVFQLNGPYAHEKDNQPNPFTDYRMSVTLKHTTSGKQYNIPGYFAADGDAANSSAQAGVVWRAHFAPEETGEYTYKVSFYQGRLIAVDDTAKGKPLAPFDGGAGTLKISPTDKSGRDLRAHGRLAVTGKRYLQHLGTGRYFLKAGADAPETLLAYKDFDNTVAGNPAKAPLKSWAPHVKDWQRGDPSWQGGKGKGLIGAVNYLSGKGCNAFSFLTYNAGGDGDNVWPFIQRNDKLHYDCSKLDQWGVVFQHGTHRGMYLHFKLQETENDDNRKGKGARKVPECLDNGDLGVQRKLYCRELIARFGHNLALNWNLGEENTQSTAQQKAMINYIAALDPYHHNIVVHTYPNQQDQVYGALLGEKSQLTGVSLQNSSLKTTHAQTLKWVQRSTAAGRPWIVAFDESGSAQHAQCPDLGYRGFNGRDVDGKMAHTQHEVRKYTLWGTLMAGGAGNEYYFGYKFAENDIKCEDWRSRDQSWDYCRIALTFFSGNKIPFWEMQNEDALVGNPQHNDTIYCFARKQHLYLVYLPDGKPATLDLTAAEGNYAVQWFNPRTGGEPVDGEVKSVKAGSKVSLGAPPVKGKHDWLVVVRRQQ